MEEFISLGASEPGASEGIIDLDHALQVDAVDLNLNLNAQPQGKPSTSTSSLLDIIDLEEGQVASQEASAQHAQGTAADNPHQAKPQQEALGANGGVGPPPSDGVIDLEEGQVEDMDLSDDNALVVVTKQHGRVSAAQTPKANNDGPPLSTLIDQSPTRGVKRARAESTEPSVRVVYNNLTRESKKKLMELMQQWSEWQARKQHASTETVEEVLDCGEETYYPALHVGSERSCAVSFWVDSQARGNAAVDDGAVPLYDREFTLGSTPMGDSSNAEGKKDKDDSRCFNCGSYSHALKDCPKPRDHVAISNARKQHNLKRNLSNVGNRGQNRYYQKTPGKFDDLKAGVLGSETRECLGLRENDPPPWLHRMRELGYPPGYLDEVEDEDKPSGITIFGDGEVKEEQQQQEEGELLEKGEASSPRKRMTVGFPGINAPVPENGDPWLWGSAPPPPLQSSSGRHNQHSSSDSRDRAPPAPPGVEHYSSSRYHSYDYGPAIPGAGRRSSSGYDDGAWTPSPSFSSRQHSGSGSGSRERERDWERERERERERDRERDRHYYSSRR
ncbi:hypothetical protein CFC21_055926 [Triticum aestivum]|uniref:CCHC-type domain-containing protein n=2 Tax=Triticum aestivum TaxID=4565 RepID=A0A3B6IMA8_WHEAT|nr:zinc finger CCHC domain-containing protein 8-like [Triticum aestivum]XP_044367691.1 zinc finger CCHC domain-containing protein 8-like [Triticum aestivum]XP_044367692.1 zinc finger CCHC domain-containing protein 8-like [Triticum aestivum]XP_044367693.1 zinc finger CCHC domain-containing protein 8-like [Triticum aestivum]KAF7046939.1 hypothetical protein CFC21_055926 [Triticum aestivum]